MERPRRVKFAVVEPTEVKNGVVKPAKNVAKDASNPSNEGSAGSSAAHGLEGAAVAGTTGGKRKAIDMETGDVTRGKSSPAWRNLLATLLPGADRT